MGAAPRGRALCAGLGRLELAIAIIEIKGVVGQVVVRHWVCFQGVLLRRAAHARGAFSASCGGNLVGVFSGPC